MRQCFRSSLKFYIVAVSLWLPVVGNCAECTPSRSHPGVVSVSVSFSFKSTIFQRERIYLALDPKLSIGSASFDPSALQAQGGALVAAFCLTSNDLNIPFVKLTEGITYPSSTAEIKFGPRKLLAQLRPVKWTRALAPGVPVAYSGVMSSIVFESQPDPDWTQFVEANWQRDSNGALLLDLALQNFGPNSVGGEIAIGYEFSGGCASGPNTTIEVPVKVSYQQGILTAASGDPDYPALVERRANLHAERCYTNSLRVNLGRSGALGPGEVRRIRYRFSGDFVADLAQKLKDILSPSVLADAFVATIEGSNVFPPSIKIENGNVLRL